MLPLKLPWTTLRLYDWVKLKNRGASTYNDVTRLNAVTFGGVIDFLLWWRMRCALRSGTLTWVVAELRMVRSDI